MRPRTVRETTTRFGTGLALLCVLGACSRSTDDWLADLQSNEAFIRGLAAAALREAPPERHAGVAATLVHMLIDSDAEVRTYTRDSLQQLASTSPAVFVEMLVTPRYVPYRDDIVDALTHAGEPAIPALLEEMQRGTPQTRHAVAAALGKHGAAAIPHLRALAARGEPQHIAAAVAGFSATGAAGRDLISETAEPLGEKLAACTDAQLEALLPVAQETASHSAIAAWVLIEKADDASSSARDTILETVIRGLLLGTVQEKPDHEPAARVLVHLKGRAVPHLIDVLLDTDLERIHGAAASALTAIGPTVLQTMLERGVSDAWIDALVTRLGEAAQTELRNVADTGATRARERARSALQRAGQ